MNQVSQLFKHWYNRGCQESSGADGVRFFYLYLCLNIVMASESGEEIDAKMIKWIKENSNSVSAAFDHLVNAKNPMFLTALQGLRDLTNQTPLESNLPNKTPILIQDHCRFDEIIDVVYRIRCNLFHGAKNPDQKRDMMLLKYSTDLLIKWVGCISQDKVLWTLP